MGRLNQWVMEGRTEGDLHKGLVNTNQEGGELAAASLGASMAS